MWQRDIRKRNEAYEAQGDWYPFVKNINEILDRIRYLDERIDDVDNRLGETQGMIRNLRKVLIKLEIVDDRFVF